VLVGAHRRAVRAGRTLVLRDVTPGVARVLHLTRLDRVLRQVRSSVCA
jgi:anti-anti-sigma regulatory factor